jgi:hypothetical protein
VRGKDGLCIYVTGRPGGGEARKTLVTKLSSPFTAIWESECHIIPPQNTQKLLHNIFFANFSPI